MTDMLHKPNGWNEPQNIMSEDEWREYFRLREVLDVEMNEEELKSSLLKVNELLKGKSPKTPVFIKIADQ